MNNISIHKENEGTNVKINNTLKFDDNNIKVSRMDPGIGRTSSTGKPKLVPMDDIGLMANPRKSSDRSDDSSISEKLQTNTYDYNFTDNDVNNIDTDNDDADDDAMMQEHGVSRKEMRDDLAW